MALNYETLIRAASKSPEERTATEVNDFIFPWLKQSLKKKQGIFQKISDDVIHDICKSVTLERRPAWDVVIRQGDPGDTFYIILQGSVNIYRLDDDAPKSVPLDFDPAKEFSALEFDSEKREEMIREAFGNYIVTLEGNGFAYRELGGFDFGERALITNEPRSATVMTITPTDLLVVDREVFSRTLKTAHEKELQEKTDFINRCPLFSSWPARLKRLVSLNLERGRFSYDGILYKQGSRADCVYFIWNGEVKLTMDPLLHWLQYPSHLPQTNPMRQRALDLFLPILQPNEPSNVHIPSSSAANGHRESFAIKRRHMTFAQAEKERQQRIIQLALLGTGDIVGLDAFVCDLSTYMNTARCTAPCDLFYILKHNFVRLQKRHGTQGLSERLRDIVRLSIQAYPKRISTLPLYNVLMKKYLSNENDDELNQYQTKQSWLLHVSSTSPTNSRRSATKSSRSSGKPRLTSSVTQPLSVRATPIGSAAALRFITNDQIRVGKIEDRLKQWHAELGETTQTQIRPLTRYNVVTSPIDGKICLKSSNNSNTLETQSDIDVVPTSMSGETKSGNLLLEMLNQCGDRTSFSVSNNSSMPYAKSPTMKIFSKQQQYEDLRQTYQQILREFHRPRMRQVF